MQRDARGRVDPRRRLREQVQKPHPYRSHQPREEEAYQLPQQGQCGEGGT